MRHILAISLSERVCAAFLAAALITFSATRADAQGCTAPAFLNAPSVPVGSYPAAVVSSDFNLDGLPDLATADYVGNSISVALAANGGFGNAVSLTGLSGPFALAAGDLDGDGVPELAAANSNTNNVSVFRNNGSGSFSFTGNFFAGSLPYDVKIADANGDGSLDVITANFHTNNVSVLFGTGTGSFQAPVNFPAGSGPIFVAATDLDNNGTLDLAVVNYTGSNISILSGDGSGGFTLTTSPAVGLFPTSLVAADLNGDGARDLATANSGANTISILLNSGGAYGSAVSFPAGTTPYSIEAAEFNSDGHIDLAVANYSDANVGVYLGSGGGNFGSATTFSTGAEPGYIAIADFDSNGSKDLAVANRASNTVSVLLNQCSGNSAPTILGLQPSLRQGTSSIYPLATVSDPEDGEASLGLNVDGGSNATRNGVSVASLNVDSAGNVTAAISASCSAVNATFTVRVTDSAGAFAEATVSVTVTASNPPLIMLNDPLVMFPANHKMQGIEVSQMVYSVEDDCDDGLEASVVIESATSDEADGSGTIATSIVRDITIAGDCRSLMLRSERDTNADGRVYSVKLRVTDSSGNIVRVPYKVFVPLNRSGVEPVEGPPAIIVHSKCR